jgi:two-component system, NtrC family, nitrogen regulation sensor histidine kinase NtrY
MIRRREAGSSLAGLISILFLYVLLMVLIIVFSRIVLQDLSTLELLPNSLILLVAIVLPVFLISSVLYNVFRLLRDKREGKPGAMFKIRLTIFFTAVSFLSAIPQGILSITFLNTAMGSWFSSDIGAALDGGIRVSLSYYNERLEYLETFAGSRRFSRLLRDIEANPAEVWDEIADTAPFVDFLHVVDMEGNEVFYAGEPGGKVPGFPSRSKMDGLLPGIEYGGASLLRAVNYHPPEDSRVAVILGVVLPEYFNEYAQRLTVSEETFTQLEMFRSAFRTFLIVFYSFFSIPLILVAIMVSFLLSGEIIRPIVYLEEATRRVSEGDFSFRILSRSGDELYSLVQSFNRMISELERSRIKLLQTEKVTAWQEIAQRMAHEIKNPLTPIKLAAQRILRRFQTTPEDLGRVLEDSVEAIVREVENLNTMLGEFRDFARLPAPAPERVSLIDMVSETVAMYTESRRDVNLDYGRIDPEIELSVDPAQIKRVLANLIGNAMDAIEGSGTVSVEADLVRKGNNQYCRVQVRDTGSGIDEDDFRQVFNPYYTTKTHGTGLGLPIVERIVFDHHGQIWFESRKGVGTTFYIDLPLEVE